MYFSNNYFWAAGPGHFIFRRSSNHNDCTDSFEALMTKNESKNK